MEGNKSTYLLAGFGVSGWIAFIIVLFFWYNTNKEESSQVSSKTIVNNYYDSSIKIVPVKSFIPVTFTVQVPTKIDTAAILKDYFSKTFYPRVFQDSNLVATINDSVTQNRLIPGQLKYQWLKPIKTVETTTNTVTPSPKQKMNLYFGGFLNVNKNYIQGFGPEIYLTTRTNLLLKANYDIKNNCFGVGGGINPFYKNARSRDKAKP